MIWGAFPEDQERHVAMAVSPVLRRRVSNPAVDLMYYFAYHPKSHFSQTQDKAIIIKTMKELLDKDYTEAAIKKAIDKFYLSPWGRNPVPIFPFRNRGFQEVLFSDAETVPSDDPVQRFIDRGGEREEEDVLPWPPEQDHVMRRTAIIHGVSTAEQLLSYLDTP